MIGVSWIDVVVWLSMVLMGLCFGYLMGVYHGDRSLVAAKVQRRRLREERRGFAAEVQVVELTAAAMQRVTDVAAAYGMASLGVKPIDTDGIVIVDGTVIDPGTGGA